MSISIKITVRAIRPGVCVLLLFEEESESTEVEVEPEPEPERDSETEPDVLSSSERAMTSRMRKIQPMTPMISRKMTMREYWKKRRRGTAIALLRGQRTSGGREIGRGATYEE